MKTKIKELLKELEHNQNINFEKGLENKVNIDYIIDRLKDILREEKEVNKERNLTQECVTVETKYKNSELLLNDYEDIICDLISLFMSWGHDNEEIVDTINNGYYINDIVARKEN